MKALGIFLFSAVALIQLYVPASMIWKREKTLKEGRVWKFRTTPLDPEDAFRGRYIRLGFVADEVPRSKPLKAAGKIYAVLKEGADGFAEVESLSLTRAAGDNVIEVGAGYWNDNMQNIEFPFNRYWVTEKIAPEAERAYAANSRRQKQNAYLTVRVHDGDTAVEQLYIDNRPLADYLRNHSSK
jgi:uncharacterized membrane-anchored protein